MKTKTVITFVIVFIVICFIAGPIYADLTDGLVAYYPFEGDADDFSGNGNNGSIFEATFVPGVIGTGLHFDGIDDHVAIPNSLSLDTSPSTIAFWWSFDELVEKSNLMLDKRNGPSYGNYSLYLLRDADYGIPGGGLTLRTEIGNGSITISALIHSVPLEENRFYFFAATYDESVLKLYLDGQLVDDTPCNMTDHTGDGDVIIGGRGDLAPGRFTNGTIDECRIYNRALSDAEIQELCGITPEPPPVPASLDLIEFFINKHKRSGTTTTAMFGFIDDLPDLIVGDGDPVACRITIELFDVLEDEGDLVISNEYELTVHDRWRFFVIRK